MLFVGPTMSPHDSLSAKMTAIRVRLVILCLFVTSCSPQETCNTGYQFTLVPPVFGFQCDPYVRMEMKTLCAVTRYIYLTQPQIDWYFQPNGLGDIVKIANGTKYIITEEQTGGVLKSELSVMNLNASGDSGDYTCVASVNDSVLLSPNRTITLNPQYWYEYLSVCPSSASKELVSVCLFPQPQPLSTSNPILVLPSTTQAPSVSLSTPASQPLQMFSIASQSPSFAVSDFRLSSSSQPLQMFSVAPQSSSFAVSDFRPSSSSQPLQTFSDASQPSSLAAGDIQQPSSSLQASSSPGVEQAIRLNEWLYISVVILLFVVAVVITSLLLVIIMLIRRNSIRNVVTGGAMIETRSIVRKPSDPLPSISEHETKLHTSAASSSSGGDGAPGAEPGVRAAWVSPAKADTSVAKGRASHRLSTLDNVTISFSPKSMSCASIYAEIGPPLSSPILTAPQAAPFPSSADGPGLQHCSTTTAESSSTVPFHHSKDHPYDTPEAIVQSSLSRYILPEVGRVPSAFGWDIRSGSTLKGSSDRYGDVAPSSAITGSATGDSWFGRWSPVFITQHQQRRTHGLTNDGTGDDVMFLTVQPSPLDNSSDSMSSKCLLADDDDDDELSREGLPGPSCQQLDGCYMFQPVGGTMDSPGVVRYLQPSATAISSEMSLAIFDDDDSPLPTSCESRPPSSSTPNLCDEPSSGRSTSAGSKSATAPTSSSRSPSSSSGYTDMSKYSGDYERDPLYMAVQRMRACRTRDSKEDGKRDTGVFSEGDGLYSPLSWIGNGGAHDSVGVSGYQSLDTTTKSPPPMYTKPFRPSSQESYV